MLCNQPVTSLTLRQLKDYTRRNELDFFSNEEEKAREWLVLFLKTNDPSKLRSPALNFVIYHVYIHTGGWSLDLADDRSHETWDGLKIHLLNAVKMGAYPWA